MSVKKPADNEALKEMREQAQAHATASMAAAEEAREQAQAHFAASMAASMAAMEEMKGQARAASSEKELSGAKKDE